MVIGSNPHPAPPRGHVGLLSRFELGVQRIHLLVVPLLLIRPLLHPPGEVQVFDKSGGKTEARERFGLRTNFQIRLVHSM